MDDNKMLTLVSNERIPLTPSMRMMFEISVRTKKQMKTKKGHGGELSRRRELN